MVICVKLIKNNMKIITAFILGLLVSGICAYAITVSSDDISYGDVTVKDALDDLYQARDNSLSVNTSTLIVNRASAQTTSFSFTPSSEYKFYVITDIYFAASRNYSTFINNINIASITNATYIDVGLTGRDGGNSSGAARSFLVIPDGSAEDITVSLVAAADSVSLYGIK